jgi:hypothetical protein
MKTKLLGLIACMALLCTSQFMPPLVPEAQANTLPANVINFSVAPLSGAHDEFVLAATVQNLKTLVLRTLKPSLTRPHGSFV